MRKTILYIHGMGGGGDSRIPSILKDRLPEALSARDMDPADIDVVVRTYSFDPSEGSGQIACWIEELKPTLIIGESLGANQALCITGLPHLFVSPSLGAPLYFGYLAFLSLIPGMSLLLDKIYKPKPGDRQALHFSFSTLRRYRELRKRALSNTPRKGSKDLFYAFFGKRDHYRRSGVVSVRLWRKYFGDKSYELYDGSHFMEEEYLLSLLIPKIIEVL